MSGVSDSVENDLLDHVLSTTPWTMPTAIYVSIHDADPGEDGSNEIASTTRQGDTAFNAAANGATSNTSAVTFTSMPSCTVSHVGLWDAASSGTYIAGGLVAPSKVVSPGATLIFDAGDINITID